MYVFKWREELLWALAQGLMVFLVETFGAGFRPEEISDWKTWLLVAAGALTRSLVVAVAAAFGRARLAPSPKPEPSGNLPIPDDYLPDRPANRPGRG
jgi:hypothetical protein